MLLASQLGPLSQQTLSLVVEQHLRHGCRRKLSGPAYSAATNLLWTGSEFSRSSLLAQAEGLTTRGEEGLNNVEEVTHRGQHEVVCIGPGPFALAQPIETDAASFVASL